jgi:hypothetical protein
MKTTLKEVAESLEWALSQLGDGFETRNAAENGYCPSCSTEADRWRDQEDHYLGCEFVAKRNAAISALVLAKKLCNG